MLSRAEIKAVYDQGPEAVIGLVEQLCAMERMPEHKGYAFLGAEIRQPISREDAFHRHHQIFPVRGNRLQQPMGISFHILTSHRNTKRNISFHPNCAAAKNAFLAKIG
jgi:hypothetical protein